MFTDKTLVITGGTGSFGNAVLKRFINTDIKEIRIFSRDEKKQDDMRKYYQNDKVKFYIGDVRSKNSLKSVMVGANYVFHAAALKQVPSCEFFPMEAVRTNVIGCENVLDSAIEHKIEKVIVLSTDKAVYPINAMGLTKALSEKVMVAKSRNLNNSGITFCGIRYGNVMASRGSVIPLFIDQIINGKDITITDPSMTRYLMTLDEAIDLVIYAYQNGENGDIFVQKSPAATMDTLVKSLLEIYNANNKLRTIGTRHGEKLFETLVNREEMVKVRDLIKYYCIPADSRNLNYHQYFSEGEKKISEVSEYTSHNTKRLNIDETKKVLMKLDIVQNDISNKH